MYCYVYDDFVSEKRHEKELARIEHRLTDLGISGKVIRLALFRNAEEMIRDEITRGATTVVAIGNDDTVRKVIDVVADSGVVFALIPLGPNNTLATALGVPEGLSACDTLSARIVETLDVGTINGKRFVGGVSVPNFRAELMCDDGRYKIVPNRAGLLEILNISTSRLPEAIVANPHDGRLEAVLRVSVPKGWMQFRHETGESVVPFEALAIRSDHPISAFADGEELTGTRFDIGVEPGRFKVVIGRSRQF